MSAEPNRLFNIADEFVTRPAQAHPERVAILGEPDAATYREVEEAVNRAGNTLRAWGCRPGDRVLVLLPDSLAFIAAFFGAAKIGAIAVPVNSMARAGDFSYYLADSGARIAIVHSTALAEFSRIEGSADLQILALAGAAPDEWGKHSGTAFVGARREIWEDCCLGASPSLNPHATSAADPAFILYTSGSGGTPKGALHRHRDMVVTTHGFAQGVLGLRADDRTYSVSKLFFAYGLGNGMYFPFSVGAATVLDPERPRPERTAEILARHRPTVFFSVPTFYAALLREAEKGLALDFSSVRMAVSAGEALPAEVFLRFHDKFGVEILDGIGSTEMLHMFLSCRPGAAVPGSCGEPVPGYEVKIVDEEGRAVPEGEIGNLWTKGESALAGYWQKPELTARTKRGEWVVTGDKFTRGPDGFYRYCGRADDMMKVAGMWVSPGEVENALLGHAAVAEAAVVAEKDAVGLVHPVAYVVLRGGAVASAELESEIRAWLRGRMVSYKCPRRIHFVGELPKTATGKIQRYRLREEGGERHKKRF